MAASSNGATPAHHRTTPDAHRGTPMQLAGMALANGVLMMGPTKWAAAVRTRDGAIRTAAGSRPQLRSRLAQAPILRGPLRLAEMMAVLPVMRVALPQARLPLESRSTLHAMLAGSVMTQLVRRRFGTGATSELVHSVASLAVLLGTLRSTDLARYHGAEHKAIGGYELGIPAAQARKEHERCGTHIAVPMLLANAATTAAARVAFPRSPQLAALIGSGLGIAASTELIRSLQRNGPSTPLTRAVRSCGMALQAAASTREPTPEQLAVAHEALEALLSAEAA